jgi:hypothetical protein
LCQVADPVSAGFRPSAGFITNNQQPMIDTAATIAAFPELK